MPVQPVSIHHMLLFILKSVFTGETETCFNTSHVTLYLNTTVVYADIGGFQYITCYSLSSRQRTRFLVWSVSIHHMLLFIRVVNKKVLTNTLFQYITCYSLSENQMQEQFPEIMFQYITCYSLSLQGTQRSNHCRVSIHHMLLFIEKMCEWNMAGNRVSIHHMLLFIVGIRFKTGPGNMFQYITCYSLSNRLLHQTTFFQSFNTSHVTLYRERAAIGFILFVRFQYITCYSLSCRTIIVLCLCTTFQYITCYSLSSDEHLDIARATRFNTSHVTLYPRADGVLLVPMSFQYITCYSLSLVL